MRHSAGDLTAGHLDRLGAAGCGGALEVLPDPARRPPATGRETRPLGVPDSLRESEPHLARVHPAEDAGLPHEFSKCHLLHNPSLLYDDDQGDILAQREAGGGHQNGAVALGPAHGGAQGLLDGFLDGGIDIAYRQQRAGKPESGQSFGFQGDASAARSCLAPLRLFGHEVVESDRPRCRLDVVRRGVGPAERDVLGNRAGEDGQLTLSPRTDPGDVRESEARKAEGILL